MSNIVSSDIFTKKRLEKEYNVKMAEYFAHPPASLPNTSIKYICKHFKVKAIMSVEIYGTGIINTQSLRSNEEIEMQLQDLEFDYTWMSNQILRLGVGNQGLVWMDIYFDRPLNDYEHDFLTALLERDVLNNYSIVDDNMLELTNIHYRIQEISEEYEQIFGKSIGN